MVQEIVGDAGERRDETGRAGPVTKAAAAAAEVVVAGGSCSSNGTAARAEERRYGGARPELRSLYVS